MFAQATNLNRGNQMLASSHIIGKPFANEVRVRARSRFRPGGSVRCAWSATSPQCAGLAATRRDGPPPPRRPRARWALAVAGCALPATPVDVHGANAKRASVVAAAAGALRPARKKPFQQLVRLLRRAPPGGTWPQGLDRQLFRARQPFAHVPAECGRDERVVGYPPDEQRRGGCSFESLGLEAVPVERGFEVDVGAADARETRNRAPGGVIDGGRNSSTIRSADRGVDHVRAR